VRAQEITDSQPDWPCRKGCDDCCRSLASLPMITQDEWRLLAAALDALPDGRAAMARQRIREAAAASRPVTCPLLDTNSGTCMVYDARPVACRAYGFYAEYQYVLGCRRIEDISREAPDVVWGNHTALESRLSSLGLATTLSEWLMSE
jgi:uncharacterized protein